MNYDLIIVKLKRPRLKQVVAHHIASDPSISLQKALSLLENLPLVYKKDLSFKELEKASLKMQKLGAVCRVVESKNPLEKLEAGKKPVEKDAEISTEKKPYLKASDIKYRKQEEKVPKRVKSFGTAPEAKPVKKKQSVLANLFILCIVIIIIVLVFMIGKNRKIKIQSTGPIVSQKSNAQSVKAKGSSSKIQITEEEDMQRSSESSKKGPFSSSGKKKSDVYSDSAAYLCQDYECEIKFYKIALSFNRYNLRAWQGLIAAYRGARKLTEAEKAERQMRELFGEKVFSVEEIVKPYGVLSKYARDENGICRIEYRSQSLKRSDLEKETYFLIRALIAQQKCDIVSLYAATGKGKGMLIRIKPDKFPSRISDYVKKASISFIE